MQLVSKRKAADMLGVHPVSVMRYVRSGLIHEPIKFTPGGRCFFVLDDLLVDIERLKTRPSADVG